MAGQGNTSYTYQQTNPTYTGEGSRPGTYVYNTNMNPGTPAGTYQQTGPVYGGGAPTRNDGDQVNAPLAFEPSNPAPSDSSGDMKYGSPEYYDYAMSKRPYGPNSYHPYGEYYNDGYRKPSQADLDAAKLGNGAYVTNGGPQGPEEPAEPVDTSYTKDDLLNTDENAKALLDMLKKAGFDPDNPMKAPDVPGQIAVPDKVAAPNVALPDKTTLADVPLPDKVATPNVALPEWLNLPDEVDLGQALDFEKAMQAAGVDVGKIDNVDISQEQAMLNQLTEAQKQQAILQSDYAVQKGTTDLQRTMQDAQKQFEAQRNQIAMDEQRALDNQALYAEARGDRGGVGQSQYNSIQNTAATNRLAVQQEQTQLATDTARQIADLRSQGEFEKANQLLSISQNYLGQLMDLYTWAKEANIGIDEFNLQVAQWEENYKLSLVNAQLDVQNSNLNLAQAKVAQAQKQWENLYNQTHQAYQDAWEQAMAQANFDFNQNQADWQNAWKQALETANFNANQNQQAWQNAWQQATDLANFNFNQNNAQFEQMSKAANDYFNNQLNAANLDINTKKAMLDAMLNGANITGVMPDGTPTYSAQMDIQKILAASGQALLQKGIIPTAEQLWAMGMTPEQAKEMAGDGNTSTGSSGGGGHIWLGSKVVAKNA